jgi:hypothetical protein
MMAMSMAPSPSVSSLLEEKDSMILKEFLAKPETIEGGPGMLLILMTSAVYESRVIS